MDLPAHRPPAQSGHPSPSVTFHSFARPRRQLSRDAAWSELELGLRGTDELFDLELDPYDPQVLLAATKQGLRKSYAGLAGGSVYSTELP